MSKFIKIIIENKILMISFTIFGLLIGFIVDSYRKNEEKTISISSIEVMSQNKSQVEKYNSLELKVKQTRIKDRIKLSSLKSSLTSNEDINIEVNIREDDPGNSYFKFSEIDFLKIFRYTIFRKEAIDKSIRQSFSNLGLDINQYEISKYYNSIKLKDNIESFIIEVSLEDPINEELAYEIMDNLLSNTIKKVNSEYILELNNVLDNYQNEIDFLISEYQRQKTLFMEIAKINKNNVNLIHEIFDRNENFLKNYSKIKDMKDYILNFDTYQLEPVYLDYSSQRKSNKTIDDNKTNSTVFIISYTLIAFLFSFFIVLFRENFIKK